VGQLEDFVNSKFFVCLYFNFASFLQGLLLDERDLEEAEDDDVITPAKIRDKTDHFVHLAKYFVVIQWSGRHVKGRAKKKMIGRKDVEIGGRALPLRPDLGSSHIPPRHSKFLNTRSIPINCMFLRVDTSKASI